MESYTVRKATTEDAATLAQIGRHTFYESFAADNSPVDMQQYLDEKFTKDAITEQLHHPGTEFYLAFHNKDVIGYLKINTGSAQTEFDDRHALEIERIYISTEHHGRGAGQLLFDIALREARAIQVDFIWLGVWEKNYRAVRFYEKQGFKVFGEHIFMMGSDPQVDMLMKLEEF